MADMKPVPIPDFIEWCQETSSYEPANMKRSEKCHNLWQKRIPTTQIALEVGRGRGAVEVAIKRYIRIKRIYRLAEHYIGRIGRPVPITVLADTRTKHVLEHWMNIEFLDDVQKHSMKEVLRVPNMGRKSYGRLVKACSYHGIELSQGQVCQTCGQDILP